MRFRIFILAVFAFLFWKCSSNNVTVTSFSPEGEVEKLTNFVIEFSHDLAPAEIIDLWVDTNYISFTPKIPGKFKWTSANVLVFSPEVPLAPIQDYEAEINDEVLFGKDLSTDFETHKFHTPSFDVIKVDHFWTNIPRQSYRLSVQANIYFNYPVDPSLLKKYMKVKLGDNFINEYKIVTEQSSDIIAVNFGEIKQQDKEQKFTLILKSELESVFGKKNLGDERTFESILPPITRLAITDVTSGFSDQTGWFEIYTTQTLDNEGLEKYITTDPKKKLEFFVNDNRLRVETELGNVQTINLLIKKGLKGLYGGVLEDDFEQKINLVNVSPSIEFADNTGLYLMRGGLQNLEVNAVNIDEVEVEYAQVFDNNLIHFLNQNRSKRSYYYSYYDYDEEGSYDYDDYYYSYNSSKEYYIGNFGKSISKENINLKSKTNWLNKFSVNVKDQLDQRFKGIYVITVRSAKKRYISDAKIVSLSNLGIITKSTSDELMVFVNEINSTESVSGAEVKIISDNNQVMLSGKTNSDGVVKFSDIKKNAEGFSPQIIIVEKDGDYNYLDLITMGVDKSRFDVGGLYQPAANFNLFIYGPRELYRPGDDVTVSGILRNDNIKVINEEPVIIKIITPTGKTFDEFKKDLNEQGSFDLTFNLPVFAQTGNYTAEVYTGSKLLIGSYGFTVEEFVPDKIRMTVKSEKEIVKPGENFKINFNAEFLYGAKASGLDYNVEFRANHIGFSSKKYPGYNFSYSSIENSYLDPVFLNGKLNENGEGTSEYKIPPNLRTGGYINATATVNVFDLTGRTLSRWAETKVFPKNYFVGIKAPGYYNGVNENLNFNLIAVDEKDNAIKNFKAVAKLVRYEWQTVLKRDHNGRYYYASEEKEFPEWERKIVINDKTPLVFKVSRSGKYQVRIFKEDTDDYQMIDFYAYGWRTSTATSFQVDKEGRVEIVTDKKEYQPGETAKILFTTPFSGKMLVTIERNNIQSYEYVNVENKSAELDIKLNEENMPNVYISATLFKKHSQEQATPFLVGNGFASIKVIKKDNIIPVSISAPEKIKPNTVQDITIKTSSSKNVYVTLAAVDEGILQITNYETPNPFDFMYTKRPLQVNSYNLYKLLLPEIGSSSSSTGGDGMEEETKKRTNPVSVKRIKLLSYWSGIKKTDSNGEVKVSLNIPQFNGNVRLMAVAYSNDRFGSSEKAMLVADDIIIEPQIPRFLSVNDLLTAPVTVLNTTDKTKEVKLSLRLEGPLKSTSINEKTIKIKPKSSEVVVFNIAATSEVGAAKIIFSATGQAAAKEVIDIAVRPISPLVVESGSGIIKANTETKIDLPKNFLKGTQNTTVTISRFPAIKFAKQLKYLVGYPHGCIEQTVSKLFPQLYFEDLAKLAAPDFYKTTNPVYYVKEGIKKIESMQLYDGSISYWQGEDYSNWWGSVYAAHFLIEAKKAKYNVSENVLNRLLTYLSKQAKEQKTYNYVSYSSNGARTVYNKANKEILYSLYVLALAKREDISTMNYYKSRLHLLTEDSRYLLAGAYALAGRWNSYYEVVPNSYQPVKTDRQTGESFDSEIRSNAIMLNVLLEVEPSNKQVPSIVKYLTANLPNAYSTQEQSFTFLALGKAAKNVSGAEMEVDVIANGKSIGKFSGKDISIKDSRLNTETLSLKSKGKGELYYFWSSEGIKVNEKVKEEDSNLRIRREYFNYRTKAAITNNTFTQGDLVVCKISLYGMSRSAENIVITDLIPAGFEIENPRLNPQTETHWKTDSPLIPDYTDIRDDRLLLFTGLQSNVKREFIYLLRVVNQGKYQLPVIGAEAMYDPEYHSYNGAGEITIRARE